jgi:hypothetical protein
LRLGKLSFPYEQGFPAEYCSLIPPRLAVRDALRLEAVVLSGRVAVDLRPPVVGLDEAHYRVQVYSAWERGLDEIMPFLQNLNLRVIDQIQFKVDLGGRRFFIRSFSRKADGEWRREPFAAEEAAANAVGRAADGAGGRRRPERTDSRYRAPLERDRPVSGLPQLTSSSAAASGGSVFIRRYSAIPESRGFCTAISRAASSRTRAGAIHFNAKKKPCRPSGWSSSPPWMR